MTCQPELRPLQEDRLGERTRRFSEVLDLLLQFLLLHLTYAQIGDRFVEFLLTLRELLLNATETRALVGKISAKSLNKRSHLIGTSSQAIEDCQEFCKVGVVACTWITD